MAKPRIQEKRWSKEFEPDIYESWKSSGKYAFREGEPLFSIDTPPPYVNKPIHIGHAATYVLMDMFARFHRMMDFSVLFPLGLDRNGLPIEMEAEKKFGVSIAETGREEFIAKCRKILDETSAESVDSFERLGISFNSWKRGDKPGDVYHTDSPEYRSMTQATFIDLWNKGLVYEDTRINNYCPGCRTTIADAEIEYAELPSVFVDVKFRAGGKEDIIISTTRPELICTCGMLIFNPDDERYQHLEGKTAVTPLFGKGIPIKAHPMADPSKGTGLVMMCSAGDQHDIRFFREQGLEPVIAIDADGTMNENAGFLEGLSVKNARKKIIEELEKEGLIEKKRKVHHRTPVCERSKDPVEFIEMPELYLKQVEFKDEMRKISKEINFFSPESRQILINWIDSVSIDWPISRRRYYATEIPLWYCEECGATVVPEKGKYYRPWKEEPPVSACKCGSEKFRGEERVFDTWFDSSSSPLHILKWPELFFEEHTPCSLRPQGKEIVRTWLYYTLLKGQLQFGKPIFEDVWIHYHIVDEDGKKMSKSVGNVIDPHEIMDRFGAEPFRLWCAVEGNIAQTDMRCSFERIEGAGKTLTKLWNVARFISMFPEKERPEEIEPADKWILNEVNSLVKFAKKRYENYDFHEPALRIRHFLWETFASHYLELVKSRAYNEGGAFSAEEQQSALYTLHQCLKGMLLLWAPVVPFITQKLYDGVYGEDVHEQVFPSERDDYGLEFETNDVVSVNSEVWKAKKDAGRTLKDPVKSATVPELLKPIEKDLKNMHNIKNLGYGELLIEA